MHCNGSRGILSHSQKPLHDSITRGRPIDKKQVFVIKSCLGEPPRIVHPLVEPDNRAHSMSSEIWEVVFWSMQRVAIVDGALVVWAGKGKELS